MLEDDLRRPVNACPDEGFQPAGGLKTFVWTGIDWTAQIIFQHSLWILAALALVGMGCLFFQRFDPSFEHRLDKPGKLFKRAAPAPETSRPAPEEIATPILPLIEDARPALGSLPSTRRFHPGAMLGAE